MKVIQHLFEKKESCYTIFDCNGENICCSDSLITLNDILTQIRKQKIEGYRIEWDNMSSKIRPSGMFENMGMTLLYTNKTLSEVYV